MDAPEASASAHALKGVGVLVTRPRAQAENLAAMIEQQGGKAIRFPTIEIIEPRDPQALTAALDRLDEFALAIFISPNAVNRVLPLMLARHAALPSSLRMACIGRGSVRELKRFGVEKIIAPRERFDSEALLELPELTRIAGQEIVIFRGEGGRELLGETLQARGALVTYAACYRRARPNADVTPLLHQGERGEIHIASITSADGLRNLCDMVGKNGQTWLRQIPLVVVSQRLAALAQELGFKTAALVSGQASDEAILQTIKAWRLTQKTL